MATPAEAGCKEEPAKDRLNPGVTLECGAWLMVCEHALLGARGSKPPALPGVFQLQATRFALAVSTRASIRVRRVGRRASLIGGTSISATGIPVVDWTIS